MSLIRATNFLIAIISSRNSQESIPFREFRNKSIENERCSNVTWTKSNLKRGTKGKKNKRKTRKAVIIVIHCSRDGSILVQMTTHSENRIYSLESGTCLLNRETFRAGCVQESGNWPRFRSRFTSRHRQPPFSPPLSRSWPSSLDEFRDTANKPARREGDRSGEEAEGKFGNCLSAGYPQNRFACFSRKWDKRR